MAKSMGATYTLKVTSKDPREMAQKVEELMGVQPEITIECSGATPSLQTAIYVS
jgi:L-iditol 2-dehydrogenase